MAVGMDMFCFPFVDVNGAAKTFQPRGHADGEHSGGRSCMSLESASMIFYDVQRHWCQALLTVMSFHICSIHIGHLVIYFYIFDKSS